MKKEQFIELYQNLTIKELCTQLNCSTTAIYSMLKRYGIPKKGNKFRDYGYMRDNKNVKYKLT